MLLLFFITAVSSVLLRERHVILKWDHQMGEIDVFSKNYFSVNSIVDKDTVLSFAQMSSNAYESPNGSWVPVDDYKLRDDFGFNNDGVRAHFYVSDDNSTGVIAFKGTSFEFLGIGGETSENDKLNDNMLFSCCCSMVDRSQCGCIINKTMCSQNCLEKSLITYEPNYYRDSIDIYKYITSRFNITNYYVTGHSLGGTIASLLAATFNLTCLAFESPGDLFAMKRLGIYHPEHNIYHYGVSGDPIFTGTCGNLCWLSSYSIETKCHSGKVCMYKSGSTSMNYHRITVAMKKFYIPMELPDCDYQVCNDCIMWTFI